MSDGRLIRHADLAAVPWKNGLGITREIGVVPDAVGGFRFRLSRAQIDDAAPFSAYPGVRRWLTLARGGALELRFGDGTLRMLERSGDGCAFPGEAAVEGVPLDGPTEDVNLMVADPTLDADVIARPLVGSMILHQPAQHWLLFHLLDGRAQRQGDGAVLTTGDTLWIDPVASDRIAARIDGSGMALVLRIGPLAA